MEVPDLGEYRERDWPAPQKGHAAMITRLDSGVGQILDKLHELRMEDRTLVLFTSDNGPHAEGGYNPAWNNSGGPLRGHKRDLYEGGIRVPLIARWPGHVPASATSPFMGAFWDMLPTLAELAGARVPSDRDGLSFVPTLLGRESGQKQHDYLYWEFHERGGARALRQGKWKIIEQPIGSPLQLYDLDGDIAEKRDCAREHPEEVAAARRLLDSARVPNPHWNFTGGKKK